MTEVPTISRPPRYLQFHEEPQKFKWEKKPDPVVDTAAKALKRHREKQLRVFDIHTSSCHDGVYVLPNWNGYLPQKIGQARGVSDLLIRGGSAHNVSFGLADVRNPTSGTPSTIRVAIKTFDNAAFATRELANNLTVLERGFASTNPMFGIFDSSHGYIITPARMDVQPLDTEPWHQFNSSDLEVREHFVSRLDQVAKLLADLNSKGINHSDSQIKNFWVSNYDGTIEAIDWEAANISDLPVLPEVLLKIAIDDLRILFSSLNGDYKDSQLDVFTGPKQGRWSQFKAYVLEPYISRLSENLFNSGELTDGSLNSIIAIEDELAKILNV